MRSVNPTARHTALVVGRILGAAVLLILGRVYFLLVVPVRRRLLVPHKSGLEQIASHFFVSRVIGEL